MRTRVAGVLKAASESPRDEVASMNDSGPTGREPTELPSAASDVEGTPRWVKIFGAIALLLIVLFVYRHLVTGGMGNHGTSNEMPITRESRPDDLHPLRIQLTVDALAAMVALVVATVLAVYKPKGLTPYGRRTQ